MTAWTEKPIKLVVNSNMASLTLFKDLKFLII